MACEYPLFLPNVTKTYTNIDNALVNETQRVIFCKAALSKILEFGYFKKVVIVDGSNHQIFTDKEIQDFLNQGIEFEQLCFQQDAESVLRFGKSHGEIQITNYMIDNSVLVKRYGGFYKISPRYTIDNLDSVFKKIESYQNVFYFYQPFSFFKKHKYAVTIFYKCSIDFYKKHLYNSLLYCNYTKSGFLEAIFYEKLKKLNKKSISVDFMYHSGIAGTTGKELVNNKFLIRNLLSKLRLLCFSFKDD